MRYTLITLAFLAILGSTAPVSNHNTPEQQVKRQDNAAAFSDMLDQYNELQEQTMEENMEMQKAQAFWNPLESMSKQDATSKK